MASPYPSSFTIIRYHLWQTGRILFRYAGIFFVITFAAFLLVYTQTDWRRPAEPLPSRVDDEIRSALQLPEDPLTDAVDREVRRFFVPPDMAPRSIAVEYAAWSLAPWRWAYGWTGFGGGVAVSGDRIEPNLQAWDLALSSFTETFIWALWALGLSIVISLPISVWRAVQPSVTRSGSLRFSLLSCVPVYAGVYLLYGLKGQVAGAVAGGATAFLLIAIPAIALLDGILLENVTVFNAAWVRIARRKFIDTARAKFPAPALSRRTQHIVGQAPGGLKRAFLLLYAALFPAGLWLRTVAFKRQIMAIAATVDYHILKNALIATIPTWGTRLSIFVSAAVVIEIPVGALVEPGLGRVFLTGYQQGEWPLILDAVWLTAGALILFSMMVDLAFQRLNRDTKGSEGSHIQTFHAPGEPAFLRRYGVFGLAGLCLILGILDLIYAGTDVFGPVFNSLVATMVGTLAAGLMGGSVGLLSLWRPSLSLFTLQTVELFPRVVIVSLLFFPITNGTDSRTLELLALGILAGFVSFPDMARVIRTRIQSYNNTDFIDAARAAGLTRWRILRSHIWPDSKAMFAAVLMQAWITVIFVESAVSFYTAVGLGEGPSGSTVTLGGRLADLRGFQQMPADLISWLFTISLIVFTIILARSLE